MVRPYLGACALLLPLLLGPDLLAQLAGVDDSHGSLLERLVVIAGLGIGATLLGVHWPRLDPRRVLPLWVLIALFALGFLLALLQAGFGLELNPGHGVTWGMDLTGWGISHSRALRALVGYLVPWAFFFVRLRPLPTIRVMAWLPAAAWLLTTALTMTGVRDGYVTDQQGVFRLEGILPAAYIGAVGMYGVIAGLWLWIRGHRDGLLATLVSGVVLLLSFARGPVIFAAIVVALVVFAPWRRFGLTVEIPRRVRLLSGIAAVPAAALFAYIVIDRLTKQNEVAGVLTARNTAWQFYWDQLMGRPWLGWGMGANSEIPQFSGHVEVWWFQAPHNIYLQLVFDFGFPLGIAMIAALVWLYIWLIGRLRGLERAFGIALALATAEYAFFDNQLTAYQPAVLSVVLFAALWGASAESASVRPAAAEDGPDGLEQDQQVLPG